MFSEYDESSLRTELTTDDDEALIRRQLCATLNEEGLETAAARSSGEEEGKRTRNMPPELNKGKGNIKLWDMGHDALSVAQMAYCMTAGTSGSASSIYCIYASVLN